MCENYLNCWKTLKLFRLQRKNEICLSVIVTKVEKTKWMTYGENLSVDVIGNQQLSSEQEKAQRSSRMGVGTSVSKWIGP